MKIRLHGSWAWCYNPLTARSIARALNMNRILSRPLNTILALTAAMGVALAGFMGYPPCECTTFHEAAARPAACPHCHSAEANPTDCHGSSGCSDDDCGCPCCHGSPADQPLVVETDNSIAPHDLEHLLNAPASDWFSPPTATIATGGWREEFTATSANLRLAKLCRWLI